MKIIYISTGANNAYIQYFVKEVISINSQIFKNLILNTHIPTFNFWSHGTILVKSDSNDKIG